MASRLDYPVGDKDSGALVQVSKMPPLVTNAGRSVSVTFQTAASILAANDVISGPIVFSQIGPPGGGSVMITSAQLRIDITAVIAGMTNFLLYLYKNAPPSALADNAAHDIPAGDRSNYLGFIDLGTPVDLGSTLYVETNGINKQIKLIDGDVHGYVVTVGTWTPSIQTVSAVTLHTLAL